MIYVKHFTYSLILLWHSVKLLGYLRGDKKQVMKLAVCVQTEHPGNLPGSTLHPPHQLHYLLLTPGCNCSPLPSPKTGRTQNPVPLFTLEQPTLEGKCKELPSVERFSYLSMHYNYTNIISLIHKQDPLNLEPQHT